ncbi:MAG: ABC transporter ATP-binding protein [Acidobacteria bacterium ACB2]|nr:ABC transporter ATP-binding protein [Acidobacteria bacterium ACB2]
MIHARALVKRFGTHAALRGVDLDVERGELFALIGPDGAGKTTFFRLVAGVIRPTSGTVERTTAVPFGLVPQRFSLYEDLTVDENLALRARLYSVPEAQARERATDLLARVGLSRFGSRLGGALSGGMKQKLALVAALLTRPDLLLLDEPTTGVDPVSRREFWLVLNELHHQGLTIVVSTPYMDEAEYATRIGFLDGGRLLAVGSREEVVGTYDRALVEVLSSDRPAVRARLSRLVSVDDISLFGARLHVRGAEGAPAARLLEEVRSALSGVVGDEAVRPIAPSLEDVFVLAGEEEAT